MTIPTNIRLSLTQKVLKNYLKRIGKDSFFNGYYYSTESNKFNLGIKALACDISNLSDKIEFSNSIKAGITEDIKKEWNLIIDSFYVNVVCK